MADFIKEEELPEDRLLKAVRNLRAMHEDICVTEHALFERGRRFMPYEPTFFLYNYFSFNSLFAINWQESIESGEVIDNCKGSERDRIKKLIDFCFSETRFVQAFYPTFIEIVTVKYDATEIEKAMESIVPEGVRISDAEVGTFRTACKEVLSKFDCFTERNLKTIFSFIYAVRCNIVHGTKSMQHMEVKGQRDRILVYSYFIIALTHMLFMCLEFHSEGFYSDSSSCNFITNLKEVNNYHHHRSLRDISNESK